MTDYLDQLLEQQEQDEQGGALEWRRLDGCVYAGERYKAANPDGVPTQYHGSNVDEVSGVEAPSSAATGLTRQLERLHRAVCSLLWQAVCTPGRCLCAGRRTTPRQWMWPFSGTQDAMTGRWACCNKKG